MNHKFKCCKEEVTSYARLEQSLPRPVPKYDEQFLKNYLTIQEDNASVEKSHNRNRLMLQHL